MTVPYPGDTGRNLSRDTEPAPVDNTPLFEAMDRMTAEIPKEDWERLPSYESGSMIAVYGAPPPPKDWQPLQIEPLGVAELRRIINTPQLCPECGLLGLHICKDPEPFQPWRRGSLASWTLVNISCHDGRLTIVMKRGRGELIDETGLDEPETWRRLEAKARDYRRSDAPGTT